MHDHHEHEHHHEHSHQVTPSALLHHMHEHNVHHAEELDQIAGQLTGEAARKVQEAVALMRESNAKLAEALKEL